MIIFPETGSKSLYHTKTVGFAISDLDLLEIQAYVNPSWASFIQVCGIGVHKRITNVLKVLVAGFGKSMTGLGNISRTIIGLVGSMTDLEVSVIHLDELINGLAINYIYGSIPHLQGTLNDL